MKKLQQILAILCIIILVGLYVVTFILAIMDSSSTMYMFKGCVALTIFIPLVAYGYMLLHKYAMHRSGRKNSYSNDESEKVSDSEISSDNGSAQS